MIFLYVILGILALIALLLVSYLRVQFLYTDAICTLHICIGPIRYKVPMQKEVQYRKLVKKLRKKKLSSKTVSTVKKETKQLQVLEELRGDLLLPVFLKKLKDVLIDAATHYAKKMHIQIDCLHITVGTGNPASTGISYGICTQSVAYFLEFLDSTVILAPLHKDAVQIRADFTGDWRADIKGTVKIRIIHLLQALLSVFFSLKSNFDMDSGTQQRFNH